MYKENILPKQGWQIIVIIKDSILINSCFPNRFWAEVIEIANYLQNRLSIRS